MDFREATIKESWLRDEYVFGLDFVFERLRPAGPYGKMGFSRCPVYLPGDEDKLNIEFDYMENINRAIRNNKTSLNIIRGAISEIKNISGSYDRLINQEVLTEIEFFEIKSFNNAIGRLTNLLEKYGYRDYSDKPLRACDDITRLLDPEDNKSSTFMIYSAYSKGLKQIRDEIDTINREIDSKKLEISNNLRDEYGIMPRNALRYVIDKGEKELIEKLKKDPRLSYVSEDYLKMRFQISDDHIGKDLFIKIENLKTQELKEEEEVLEDLSLRLEKYSDRIIHNIEALSKLDFRLSKGILIDSYNLKRPKFTHENLIHINGGRHLKTEYNVKKDKRIYTPIDICFRRGVSCITGANMGGKTVSLKMLGQAVIMAQLGFFVPCESMDFSLRSFVSISSGDSQSVDTGLSTFGSEIINIKEALKDPRDKGLVLIDELARGTNPLEGTAISKAIIKHLSACKLISVVTTHFEGVGNMEEVFHYQVRGLKKESLRELREENIRSLEKIQLLMDYSLVEANAQAEVPKDAIEIAKLLGLDENIIEIAERFLREDV